NPRSDIEPIRALIALKAGQPFSEASVRATMATLENNGFNKVSVRTISNASGLHLDFILEPPYYVGIVDFSTATKQFSYAQLLRVLNLSDAEPYAKALLTRCETVLVRFFESDGFFQAKVHAEPKIDDVYRLVNIKFSVQLGKRARIGAVEVRGVSEQEREDLVETLRSTRARFTGARLKPGKAYTSDRNKAATALIKKTLA